jgi:hypothetical protein
MITSLEGRATKGGAGFNSCDTRSSFYRIEDLMVTDSIAMFTFVQEL